MDAIRTAGDLRGFLADIMVGIREGKVNATQAHAISKVAAQINQSLAVEVNTALQLERMGKDRPIAGSMMIRGDTPASLPEPEPERAPAVEQDIDMHTTWFEQATHKLNRMDSEDQLGSFIVRQSANLDKLLEVRPDLHTQITVKINETRERVRPSETKRIEKKIRTDLEWCDQCDGMVAPEDSSLCKSRFCGLKAK